MGVWSGKQEYDRQVAEGNNYTNWVSIGVVGISNTLLCLIPGGKAVSAYKMATAGGSFVFKTFAVQLGKAVGLGVAAGYATDAGIEVARQLATGTKLSNLEYDRINEADVTGAIAGGAGAIFGASVEALANTRVGKSVVAKATEVFGKGKTAVKNGFAKVAKNNRGSVDPSVYKWSSIKDSLSLKFDSKWTAYLDDIEMQTGVKIQKKQRKALLNELRNNSHEIKLVGTEYRQHRKDFNDMKADLIKAWEDNTGQKWPTYSQDVISKKKGDVYILAGSNFDAHEIIPNVYDSPLEWWNLHPAANPNQHQGGIHRSGAPIKEIFK